MTGIIQKALASGKRYGRKVFAVAVLTVVLAFTVYGTASSMNAVQDRDGEDVQTICSAENPQEDHENTGSETDAADKTNPTGYYNYAGEVTATEVFPVRVVCDGKTTIHLVTGGSVADVLDEAEIELGELDTVDLPLRALVREGDIITVTRRRIITSTEEIVLECKKKVIYTSLLREDKKRVLVEGQDGLQVNTYEQMIVDGKKQEKELLSEEILEKPVTRRVLVGKPGEPISDLDFGYEFDENGEPVGYKNVLRAQRAAGYSARKGARTASGMEAVVGHVAVDPNVIPYGTKLYIQSTDGKFVYGYAIAADTGTAIKNGQIAVDLFYGSYLESALNEIRSVDIFILE